MKGFFSLALLTAFNLLCTAQQATTSSAGLFKYDFGGAKAAPGYTRVSASANYDEAAGYGFENGVSVTTVNRDGSNTLCDGFVTSDKPFYFSVKVPDGN